MISIREIVRKTEFSRNTSRKCLASGVVEPCHSRCIVPSKLDEYANTLISWRPHQADSE